MTIPFSATADNKPLVIVIDAGHGGKDVGAVDNNVKEKDINLGVALEVEKLIKKELKGVKVIMTRDDDTYLTLQQRADKANKAKGDLFISIHTNSVDESNKNRKTVSGSSVYALGLHKDQNNMAVARRENSVIELEKNFEQKYSGFDPTRDESYIIFELAQKNNLNQSIRFADDVQKQLVNVASRRDRGVHQAGFWVLWATSMPAVLIELDFICNPNSAKYLGSSQGQAQMGKAIFNAVRSFVDNRNRIAGTDIIAEENAAADNLDVVLTSASSQPSMKTEAPASQNNKVSTSSRRRRSDRSRELSNQRQYETADIRLSDEQHTAIDEKAGITANDFENVKKDNRKSGRKEKPKENKKVKPSHEARLERFITVYKIQILASSEELKKDDPRFCGLSPISSFRENNLYKYTVGESQNKNEILKQLIDVKKKFPDAFVITAKKSVKSTSE